VFFADILSRLQAGTSFSVALKESKLQLPDYIYPLAEAGELTGNIAKSLRDGLDQMRYEHQVAAEMKNALIYPVILIFSGIAAVLLIFIVVVPKFSGLLKKSDGDLPLIAELTLSTGMFFNNNLLLVSVVIVTVISSIIFSLGNEKTRQKIWDTALTLPVIGEWLTTSEIARWSAMFSTLLSSSIEITQALSLAQEGVKGTLLNAKLTQVIKSVKGGESLAKSLQENGAITAMGYGLVKVGEVSGELPKMLNSLSQIYTDNSKERMTRFLTLLEPIAIVSIGGVIGTIMTGIILAITSANDIAL
jgi:general secretion pathway protein F